MNSEALGVDWNSGNLMLALARKIVADEEDAGSVESVFEQAQQVAAEAEALLVDEGWHAPAPEPVAVEVEAAPVGVSPDDRHEDAREQKRTLFSWAEFLAGEPDEPEPRKRRDEAPTLSLFEWALEQEQALAGGGGLRWVGQNRLRASRCRS